MKLRWYQTEAVDSIFDWFNRGGYAPLIVTPTGSGKSVILAEFINQIVSKDPTCMILVVTHVKELVLQDYEKIKLLCPHVPTGIFSAGLGRKQLKQVTVASIQSVFRRKEFYGRFDIIVIDEAHLIPHKSEGMYQKLLQSSASAHSGLRLVGLTATPFRLDSGLLHMGEGAMFDGISYEVSIKTLIEHGFLCPVVSKLGEKMDVKDVKLTGGDFNQKQLGEKYSAIQNIEHHTDVILEKCEGRKSILVFAVTIDHARQVSERLAEKGIPADYVSGEMERVRRDAAIRSMKSGEVRALVNCGILTTGFDHPAIDAVVMLRPTMSAGLYLQMVGRGFRIHPEKQNCLVLDFGGNVERHGMIDQVLENIFSEEERRKPKKAGEAPVKQCEECGAYNHAKVLNCVVCNWAFPVVEKVNEKHEYTGDIVSSDKDYWLDVQDAHFVEHIGQSGIPTLKVTYDCGLRKVPEYICIEHSGYAGQKAERWMDQMCPGILPITTVAEAVKLSGEIFVPEKIRVSFSGKFPEIKEYVLTKRQQKKDVINELFL